MAETNPSNSCLCSVAPKLIFACSGASDLGHLADLAARKLAATGAGQMFCLAGIGGRVSGIIASTRSAAAVLAVDGCPLDCTRKCLEQAGLSFTAHLRLTDLGMERGKSPPTEGHIERVVAEARGLLDAAGAGA